jgi:hypothetical protein
LGVDRKSIMRECEVTSGDRRRVETKKSQALSVVGIVLALLLFVGIAYTGTSVLRSISAESGEVNRDVASAAGMNATIVFPRAVVEGTVYFFISVSFVTMLPANASYSLTSGSVIAYFHSGSLSPDYETRGFAEGYYDFLAMGVSLVKGDPRGGMIIYFWNITVWMNVDSPPRPPGFPQNQSWMSFINQAETHLGIWLDGSIDMVAANGTNYNYTLGNSFDFQGNPTTFYMFSYPAWAWLGYGGSILVALFLLIREKRRSYA